MTKIKWGILMIGLIAAYPLGAETVADLDAQWQKLVNDEAFSYRDKQEALQRTEPHNNIFSKIGEWLLAAFNHPTGKMVGWIIFFVLVAWALYKIFFNGNISLFGKKAKTINTTAEADNGEESLTETNWEYHLNEAIRQNDTRLAMRYSYMWLLQLLQHNGLILYRNDKTNNDYYHELNKQELRQPFRQLSRQYEYTWYGHFTVSDEAYNAYINLFNEVKTRLLRP